MSNPFEIPVGDEQESRSMTVADLVTKLNRLDPNKYVFFQEPYDEGDELGINDVEERSDSVILS